MRSGAPKIGRLGTGHTRASGAHNVASINAKRSAAAQRYALHAYNNQNERQRRRGRQTPAEHSHGARRALRARTAHRHNRAPLARISSPRAACAARACACALRRTSISVRALDNVVKLDMHSLNTDVTDPDPHPTENPGRPPSRVSVPVARGRCAG